jgi:hypothetical protein
MNLKLIAILFLLATPAAAEDWKSWVEPPLGPISPTGSSIEVENYRCKVTGPRSIECMNIGRVCVASRAEEDKKSARQFGCAIEGNKNYPCPKDEPEVKEKQQIRWACSPMSFGFGS